MEDILQKDGQTDNIVYNIKPLYINQIDSQYSQSSAESSHSCSHAGDAQIEDQVIIEEKFEDSFVEDPSVVIESPDQNTPKIGKENENE